MIRGSWRMNLNSRVIRGCRVSDCGNNGFGERKGAGAYMGVSKKNSIPSWRGAMVRIRIFGG